MNSLSVAVCLVLVSGIATFAAQDVDPDVVRMTYERQFEDLDQDNDGFLDEAEQGRMSSVDLAALQSNGLAIGAPVSREAFVLAGIATTAAAAENETETLRKDSKETKTDVATAAKSAVSAAAGMLTRNPTRKSHFVPELPEEYSARDKNGDGQIALYEWDRKKYTEFAKLDKNGDGFLTPTELMSKEMLKNLYSKAATRAGSPGSTPGKPGGGSNSGEQDAVEKEARGTFAQLDDNKDGSIDESDWGKSQRTRRSFEMAGIKVSLPMNADAFVAHFRKVRETPGNR